MAKMAYFLDALKAEHEYEKIPDEVYHDLVEGLENRHPEMPPLQKLADTLENWEFTLRNLQAAL